jgi:hypothetical protein
MEETKDIGIGTELKEESVGALPVAAVEKPKEASDPAKASEVEAKEPKKRGRPRKDAISEEKILDKNGKKEDPAQKVSLSGSTVVEKKVKDKISPKKRGRPPKDKSDVNDAAPKKRGRPPTKTGKAPVGEQVATGHSLDPLSPKPTPLEKGQKTNKKHLDSSAKKNTVKKATTSATEVSPTKKRGRPKKEQAMKDEAISKKGKKVSATSKEKSVTKQSANKTSKSATVVAF